MNTEIHFGQEVASKLRQKLIVEAEQIAKKYPQYKGAFDHHILVRLNRSLPELVPTVAFNWYEPGEFFLAEPEIVQYSNKGVKTQVICIWDENRKVHTYIPFDSVDFVEKNVKCSFRTDY